MNHWEPVKNEKKLAIILKADPSRNYVIINSYASGQKYNVWHTKVEI